MSHAAAKNPRSRPKLNATEQTEMIVNEMLLLRAFPNHEQAPEFIRNLHWAEENLPALHAHAEILVAGKLAEEGRIRAHPEECRRCQGTGMLSYLGRVRFCGCPAGDLASQTEVLPDPSPARPALVPKPMSERHQLEQLRSLFKEES